MVEGVGGGVMDLPWGFVLFQYLEKISPLVDSLLRGPVTSAKMAAKMAAILDFIENQKLSRKGGN